MSLSEEIRPEAKKGMYAVKSAWLPAEDVREFIKKIKERYHRMARHSKNEKISISNAIRILKEEAGEKLVGKPVDLSRGSG
jgi:hypothetical protein